jgi:hypothetical protein
VLAGASWELSDAEGLIDGLELGLGPGGFADVEGAAVALGEARGDAALYAEDLATPSVAPRAAIP